MIIKVYLIDDTIRNNVAFGINTEQVQDAKIWSALEKAQLKEFVEALPLGLNTIIGERGVKFFDTFVCLFRCISQAYRVKRLLTIHLQELPPSSSPSCVCDVELYDVFNERRIGMAPEGYKKSWSRDEIITRILTYQP